MHNKLLFNSCFEVKTLNDSGDFDGYASIFGVIDLQNDMIVKGAFKESLRKKNEVKLLWQHRHYEPIGQIISLREDQIGLYVKARLLTSITRGKEALSLLRSRVIKGLSIGYKPIDYHYDDNKNIRIITKVDLWEISVVTFPANSGASVRIQDGNTNESKRLVDAISKAKQILDITGKIQKGDCKSRIASANPSNLDSNRSCF